MARITMDIAPDVLVAGQRYRGDVVVQSDRPVRCRRISLVLRIEEQWTHAARRPSPNNAVAEYVVFQGDVVGSSTIPIHEWRIPIELDVPATAPPTHATGPVRVECTATVQVHLGGVFASSPRRILVMKVLGAPVHTDRGGPTVVGRLPPSVRADRPHVEIGLPASTFMAGEGIPLTVAIFDGPETRTRALAISFLPHFRLRRFETETTTSQYRITERVELLPAPGGVTLPVVVPIPITRAPTLDCLAHAIDWSLVVRTGGLLGEALEVTVPIRIVPPGSELPAIGPQPALSGRDDFAALATHARGAGWQQLGASASRVRGPARAVIAFDYRGGFHLVIAVHYPALELGLEVRPTRTRTPLGHDFVRTHRIDSIDHPRATLFLDGAVTALRALPDLALLEWSDTHLACARAITTLDAATFASAVTVTEQLEHAIETARALIRPGLDGGPYRR